MRSEIKRLKSENSILDILNTKEFVKIIDLVNEVSKILSIVPTY